MLFYTQFKGEKNIGWMEMAALSWTTNSNTTQLQQNVSQNK